MWRRRSNRSRASVILALVPWLVACGEAPEPAPAQAAAEATDPARVAEDRRGLGPEGIEPLREALRDPDPARRLRAVRGLGRLERPDLADTIRTALFDPEEAVRAEAAHALAQAVMAGGDAVPRVHAWLVDRIGDGEEDPAVLGAVARALGRLPYAGAPGPDTVEATLVGLTERLRTGGSDAALVDAALGLDRFIRGQGERAPGPALAELLRELALHGRGRPGLEAARVRRLATGLLPRLPVGLRDPGLVAALADPDADVRRLAVEGLPAASAETLRERLPLVVGDPEPRVRIAALRVWDRTLKPSRGCEPLLFAVRDGDPLVVLTALDLLARPCPEAARQRTTLLAIVGELGRSASWHAPARALAALAGSAPDALAGVIGPFERHDVPYVRAWAARAADRAGLEPPLTRLAGDPDPNVRTAALEGLFRIRQHGADDALLAALSSDDPQLVLTAARLLEGTPRGADVVPPLLETLDRLGARRQATLRDPRVALIARVAELGGSADAERLRPALQDPDPAVAGAVAAALSRLEGDSVSAPEPPTPVGRVPTEAEIERLERTRVLLDLESGGRVGIRLLPDLAPTNVARFVALARAGTLNGLGFHRVEPNFVVQGLSPGANEYAGHGDFTRDEVGRVSHWRGTVGISTRGHDTGDGQIFVNLVDNTRLDHSYTIIGEVELGMDVVDRIREGDRVRAATLVEGSGGA